VPEEVRSIMFEAFRQGPEALSSAAPGVGVGLALVRHFAHLHHGSVTYQDVTGGGARFVVRVRTADGPVRQTARSARP
jgi:signal transduction histidine kinase